MLGDRLDHYLIRELLGRGGMGEVYLAEDERLGRKVALKLLDRDLVQDRLARRRFETEARAVAELSHPNVATLHDIGEASGRPYLVMEYLEGETLAARIRRGPLSIAEALRVAIAVTAGLAHAHGRGVIHRDVKAENIMLDAEGSAKILDFGLARLEDMTRVTQAGTRMGTLRAMSPEQLQGADVDHRSDVWAVGVLLYEMIVGHGPFQRESAEAVAQAILGQTIEPLTGLRSGVPLELERIILKCLERDPARRYQHMSDLSVDLRQVTRDLESGGATIVVPGTGLRRRRRWVSVGVPVLVGVVALVVTLFILPRDSVPFDERDWILLTDFESFNDDAELERALHAGLEVSLQQSRYVNVYPQNQVRATLQRMEVEPDASVDLDLAREIAERESIKVVASCSISQVGEEYSLMAKLVEPESGAALDTEVVRAANKSGILDALDELAGMIRNSLGESLSRISHERTPLPRATTSSLEALKDFAAGQLAFGDRRFQAAHQAFESAIAQDSTFALAHARLGASFYWRGLGAQGELHLQRALELENRLTHRERLHLRPYVAGWRGNREQAIDGYRTYLQSYPDDSSTWFALGYQFTRLVRCDEARDAFDHVLRLRPRETAAYINIATCFANAGRRDEALVQYERAFELRPDWRISSNLNHEFGNVLVAMGRYEEAESTFRLMLDEGDQARGRGCRSLGLMEMCRGRYAEASRWLEQAISVHRSIDHWLSEARDRLYLAAAFHRRGRLEAEREQIEAVRTLFESQYPGSLWVSHAGAAMRRTGDIEGLRRMLTLSEENQNEEVQQDRAAVLRLRGELRLAEDEPQAAIDPLRQAYILSDNVTDAAALAEAHYRTGDLDEARRCYEVVNAGQAHGWEAQEPWLESHYWLGRIAEEKGEPRVAIRWYEALAESWKDADGGIALLEETRSRLARVRAAAAG